jgi:hypothetical protein
MTQQRAEGRGHGVTVMTIFSGMVSTELSQLLVSRRRDLMIESAA